MHPCIHASAITVWSAGYAPAISGFVDDEGLCRVVNMVWNKEKRTKKEQVIYQPSLLFSSFTVASSAPYMEKNRRKV